MVSNEVFIDSATLRENVVSLARNIGYVPRSISAARAEIYFSINLSSDYEGQPVSLEAGLVCVGSTKETSYTFSIPERITTLVKNGTASFGTIDKPIEIYQGTYLTKQFVHH